MLKIEGTLKEIETLIPWNNLCYLIHVDYYKKSLVSKDEIFKIEIEVASDHYIVDDVDDDRATCHRDDPCWLES